MHTRSEVLKLEGAALNAAVAEALGKRLARIASEGDWYSIEQSTPPGIEAYAPLPDVAHDLNAAFALPLEGVEFHLEGGTGIEPRAKLLNMAGRCVALADASEPATACSRAWLLWKLGVA